MLFSALNPSKSFIFICQRKLSQYQANEAKKLRLMIVGLGNHILPDTRHSVGMFLVDCLGKQLAVSWQFDRKSMGHIAATQINGQQFILLKPTVAMNLNGNSILKTATKFSVNPRNIVLAHDDLDRPLGKFSIKYGGSAGGHNGVKSAIASLKCDLMKRARIGIGRPDDKDDVTQYVLSKFNSSEIAIVRDTIERCCEVLINETLIDHTTSVMDQKNTLHR